MSRAVSTFGHKLNPKRSTKAPTVNKEGFPAFTRPIPEQFVQTLVTNTFGDTFYASKKDLVDGADAVNTAMLAEDPIFASKALVYARTLGYMRTQPIYGLVRLWEHTPMLAEHIFPRVIRTPNDLRDFMVMLMARRRESGHKSIGGRRAKRMIGNWLLHLDEYRAIKYGSENKVGFSLRDMLRIAHPEAGKHVPIFDWIMGKRQMTLGGKMVRGKLVGAETVEHEPSPKDLQDLPQIRAYEAFKAATTDAERAKYIEEGRLPHEVVTSLIGSSKECWGALVRQMPIFALLRNLATLERHDVLKANRAWIVKKLTDGKTIRKSMILPFRFVEAKQHVTDVHVQDALRDAVDIAFANIPSVEGRTAVFLDISGSMGAYVQTAALFGMCLIRKADDGRLVLFDDVAEDLNVSKRDSLLTQAEKVCTRGGTQTSAPMQKLLEEKDRVDNIILITDEQENIALHNPHDGWPWSMPGRAQGKKFIDVLDKYKRTANRNVKLFFVCVAPYQEAQLVPHTDPNTFFAYGWSDNALKFVSLASQGWGSMVDVIRSGKFEEPLPEAVAEAEAPTAE